MPGYKGILEQWEYFLEAQSNTGSDGKTRDLTHKTFLYAQFPI
jgi:hypothetical protein